MESGTKKLENVHIGLTEEHIKEGISRAYVQAIANCAGFNFEKSDQDYGIDGTFSGVKFRKRNNEDSYRRVSDGCKLDFQLKASVNVSIENDVVKYNLEAKNYNDLVDEDICTPRILIVYKLPKEKAEWIHVSEDVTLFRNCAWWCYLSGKRPTSNKEKIMISIPRKQIFNQDSLTELMAKVKKGELV